MQMRFSATASVLLLFVMTGCNAAKWREASAERRERIRKVSAHYAAHDASGGERIDETLRIHREMRAWREENLRYTSEMIRKEHEKDVRRWEDERSKRTKLLRECWRGNPETIPDTWADMTY